ncbi:hypothetical protein [Deinococcus aquatilis]|uniref:hypothetical protein n=1 Tax=Deinococcus aquatilis TaxID=519440 RepID=UPI00036C84D8|nr:hypothetical protein [Deinococcus aquatilis]
MEIVRAYAVGLACGLGIGTVMFGVLSALRTAGIPPLALFTLELLIGAGLLTTVVLFGPPSELQRLARPLPRALTERLRRWLSTISFPGERT